MKRSTFDTILSFLLGFAWALLVLGSFLVFKIASLFGYPVGLLATLIFVFWSLVCILLLEGLNLYKERSEELKEQTRLLRRIVKSLERE